MIGIFLGSFDPPHIGHIQTVQESLNLGRYEKVFVIPSFGNPWKENQTPFRDRLEMTRIAFRHFSKVKVLEIEETIDTDTIYTYQVLEKLKEIYPDPLEIITTRETISEIPNWKNGKDILKNFNFNILTVNEEKIKDWNDYRLAISLVRDDCYITTEISQFNVSSTLVRNLLKDKKIPIPYIQNEVYDYINDLNLYKNL